MNTWLVFMWSKMNRAVVSCSTCVVLPAWTRGCSRGRWWGSGSCWSIRARKWLWSRSREDGGCCWTSLKQQNQRLDHVTSEKHRDITPDTCDGDELQVTVWPAGSSTATPLQFTDTRFTHSTNKHDMLHAHGFSQSPRLLLSFIVSSSLVSSPLFNCYLLLSHVLIASLSPLFLLFCVAW